MRRKPAIGWLVVAVGFLTACEKVNVTTVAVSSVEVSPSEVSLVEGGSVRLTATLRDEDGHVLSGRDITWTTQNGSIATVDGNGTVTGLKHGVASIEASAEGSMGATSVTVFQGPTVGLSANNVQFIASSNGPEPDPVVVAIFNDGAGSLEGLAATVDYGESIGGWLLASLGSASAPTTLTIAADASDLPPGTYAAAVEIVARDAEVTRLTVTFSVDESAAVIGLSTQAVAFSHVARSPDPPPRVVSISNLGGQALSGLGAGITYEGDESGWLTASLSPTTAPSELTLGVLPGTLETGTYEATVHVSSPTALNSPVSLAVSLDVENPPPEIELGVASLNFSVAQGAPPTQPQLVPVNNVGGGVLTGLESSITYQGGAAGWLSANLVSAEAPTVLTVIADPTGVPAGSYVANVAVSSAVAANSPQILAVTLDVANNPPLIALSPTSVDLQADAGSQTPSEASVSVTNGGGGTLAGLATTIEYDPGQLTGWLTATLAGDAAPTSLQLSAVAGTRPIGTYGATVFVSSAGVGNSPQAVDVTFIVGSPPAPPSGLGATAVAPTQIDLSWTDNSDNEQSFRIERREGAGEWVTFANVVANAESATDATAAPGTTYSYRVRACTITICSAASNEASATTPAAAASPVAPSGATALATSPALVAVAWTDNSDNETSFEIERSADGGSSWSPLGTTEADQVNYADASVLPGTSYWYRIQACNGIGCSDYSESATAITPVLAVPVAPSNPTAEAPSHTQIDIGWQDNSDDEDAFEIERSLDGGITWAPLVSVPADQVGYVDTGVDPSTTYWYRVRACNVSGCSDYTSSANATTPDPPTPPAPPTDAAASAVAHDRVDVSWSDNSDDEDAFEIERSADEGATWSLIATTGPDQESYIDNAVAPGALYGYRIRACNAGGCSTYSGMATTTTPDAPSPPAAVSNLTATPVSTSRIDLAWTDNSDNELRFEIQWRRGTNGSWRWSASVGPNVTTYAATGLRKDRTHQFRVRACNDQGCSTWVVTQARTLDD